MNTNNTSGIGQIMNNISSIHISEDMEDMNNWEIFDLYFVYKFSRTPEQQAAFDIHCKNNEGYAKNYFRSKVTLSLPAKMGKNQKSMIDTIHGENLRDGDEIFITLDDKYFDEHIPIKHRMPFGELTLVRWEILDTNEDGVCTMGILNTSDWGGFDVYSVEGWFHENASSCFIMKWISEEEFGETRRVFHGQHNKEEW